VALLFVGWSPDPAAIVAGVVGYLLIIMFALALAVMLSVSQVFLRDTGQIVAVVNNFIRFGVPMMYPYEVVATRFAGHIDLYLANPIAIAVLLVQRCFWVPTTSDPEATMVTAGPDDLFIRGFIALGMGLVLLIIAQRVFNHWETKMPERL
jgi:ABC-2 type transport system permease protein